MYSKYGRMWCQEWFQNFFEKYKEKYLKDFLTYFPDQKMTYLWPTKHINGYELRVTWGQILG